MITIIVSHFNFSVSIVNNFEMQFREVVIFKNDKWLPTLMSNLILDCWVDRVALHNQKRRNVGGDRPIPKKPKPRRPSERTVRTRTMKLKMSIRMACWNNRSWEVRDQEIITQLKNHKINIYSLAKTRNKLKGTIYYQNNMMAFSGNSKDQSFNMVNNKLHIIMGDFNA